MHRPATQLKKFPDRDYILQKIQKHVGEGVSPDRLRIITDTSNFFQVDYNDVVCAGGRAYLVRGTAREGRFGLDEEPKLWVKRAIDLESGERKIIKLAFFERFEGNVGNVHFWFYRSPRKEARILELVRSHPYFMQGFAVSDDKDNILRVLDFIEGPPLSSAISDIPGPHEAYFFERLPGFMDQLMEAFTAIGFLHKNQEVHGDIRRDHILVERTSGRYVWIDFDYAYRTPEHPFGFDLFGLGNILAYVVGRGDITLPHIRKHQPNLLERLTSADFNLAWPNRVMNLKKVYPYIPDSVNNVLMHFAQRAEIYYESVDELLEDLNKFRNTISML